MAVVSLSPRAIICQLAKVGAPRYGDSCVTGRRGMETIFGASSMTPRPTRTPPTMVPAIKIAWGQIGSSAPPKNWLMYEYIAAVLVWLFVGVMVIFRRVGWV